MDLQEIRSVVEPAIDASASVISAAGVAVIAGGILLAAWRLLWRRLAETGHYAAFRRTIGKAILLGLEFLVAADIIRTVAVAPNAESVLMLGGIVLIRTFLSVALQVELDGRWPWESRGSRAS